MLVIRFHDDNNKGVDKNVEKYAMLFTDVIYTSVFGWSAIDQRCSMDYNRFVFKRRCLSIIRYIESKFTTFILH